MRVEKVYRPNRADKMAGYLIAVLIWIPLLLAAFVWSLFSKHSHGLMKELLSK